MERISVPGRTRVKWSRLGNRSFPPAVAWSVRLARKISNPGPTVSWCGVAEPFTERLRTNELRPRVVIKRTCSTMRDLRESAKALRALLAERVLVLDGAMGTMLQQCDLTAA